MWSISRGTCDGVLACHAGSILSVEYSTLDEGIITGSTEGLLRFWENVEEEHFISTLELSFFILSCSTGGIRCVRNVTVHTAAILSINAVEHWLGIGTADNSIGLKRDLVASLAREQNCLGGNYTEHHKEQLLWGDVLLRTLRGKGYAAVVVMDFLGFETYHKHLSSCLPKMRVTHFG